MKKYVAWILAVLLLAGMLAGCGNNPDDSSSPDGAEKAAVNVTAIAGPTGVGLVSLMQKQTEGTTVNNYAFNVVTAPEQAVAAITNGSADIAAVPTNLAAVLHKKTEGKVQVLAINTMGVLHILANGENIEKVTDLKGKTIYTSGQGANPEYILKYVLERNGLTPGQDVKIEFVADNDALATLMINGTAKIAMVPEPKAAAVLMQNKDVKRVLNMTAEWYKKDGKIPPANELEGSLVMGCVIARTEFVEKNPQVIRDFLAEYKTSIESATADVAATAALCETYKIIPNAKIAQAAIPHCGLTYIDALDLRRTLHAYYNVLYGYDPASIGGAIPGVDFYYYDKQ